MPPLLTLNPHNGIPAYRQLMEQIKLQIATGVLAPGAELPSTRALASELTLNPMTVSKAYSLLEREGLLERRRGQTLTVSTAAASEPDRRLAPLRDQLQQVVELARSLEVDPETTHRLLQELYPQPDSCHAPRDP